MFFWNSLAFSMIQQMLAIWSLVPLPFLNPACTSGNPQFLYCWSLAWRILNITLLSCEMGTLCGSLNILWHWPSLGLEWKLTFSSPVCVTLKWSEVAQSSPTLCNPVDCNLPGSSVHGILQARILEWVAISFSRGSSWPKDQTRVSHIAGRRSTREVPCV